MESPTGSSSATSDGPATARSGRHGGSAHSAAPAPPVSPNSSTPPTPPSTEPYPDARSSCRACSPGPTHTTSSTRWSRASTSRRSPEWAAECNAVIDTLQETAFGQRRFVLHVRLHAPTRQRTTTWARTAFNTIAESVGLGALAPARQEIELYRDDAHQVERELPAVFDAVPLTEAEQVWLRRHAQRRTGPRRPRPGARPRRGTARNAPAGPRSATRCSTRSAHQRPAARQRQRQQLASRPRSGAAS